MVINLQNLLELIILFLTKSEIVGKIQANRVCEDELINSDSGS
jgi:hypothetical protein